MNIALLGTGRMGSAIVLRLLELGHSVTVWNRTTAHAQALVAHGAHLAQTPAQAVDASQCVISVLTDAKAIEATYQDSQGVLSTRIEGKLFIDMSTVRPATSVALWARLASAGAAFVECPVGGSVVPAREGKLLGLAGALQADFERAKPLLEQLCRRVERVGEVGAGASIKLAINLPLLVYWQALGEALALAQPSGLAPERILEILTDTAGAPPILKFRAPAIAAALSGQDLGNAQFNIDSIRKDLRTMAEEAQTLGYQLPTVQAALGVFNAAAADGLGHNDGAELAAWWLANAKQPV
jgi:3-hydroxyisobutyrate dehydrogenase